MQVASYLGSQPCSVECLAAQHALPGCYECVEDLKLHIALIMGVCITATGFKDVSKGTIPSPGSQQCKLSAWLLYMTVRRLKTSHCTDYRSLHNCYRLQRFL